MTVIIILVGGLMIISGDMTMGELWLFSNLSWALIDPMRTLGTILNDLQRFFASVNKVIEIYEDEPKIFQLLHRQGAGRGAAPGQGGVSGRHLQIRPAGGAGWCEF